MMPKALAIELADAIVAQLNVGFAGTFAAVRKYIPAYLPDELDDLTVSVGVPGTHEIDLYARKVRDHSLDVSIAVQKKTSTDADNDAMVLQTEAIETYLAQRELATLPEARWQGSVMAPVFSIDHMERLGVFTAIITVTYRVGTT